MKHIYITLLLISAISFAQETGKKNFFQVLWGQSPENGITFLPVGTHTKGFKINDVFGVFYSSYNYKSLEVAVFRNSFKDWTTGVLYKREIPITQKWSVNYGAGIFYGYKAKLSKIDGIPFKKEAFSGALNPVLGGGINYRFSKKWAASVLIAPLINIYGIKYYL